MNAGIRLAVYLRDNGVCGLCGGKVSERDFHLSHDTPRSLGGGDNIGNLYIAHGWCNVTAGTLSKRMAIRKIRRLLNGSS